MSESYYSKDQDIHFVMTTPEEERQLFAKARRGDEVAKEFLIRNHLLFAAMRAQEIVRGRLPKDEVISAANFAVMKAFTSYDATCGHRFTTYLRPFIRGHISRLWKSKFSAGTIDPSASVGTQANTFFSTPEMDSKRGRFVDAEAFFNPAQNVPDESPTVEEIDLTKFNRECLATAMKALNKRDAELIRLRYVEDLTFTAIGKKRGVSREAVRARHVIIIKRLKRLVEREGAER